MEKPWLEKFYTECGREVSLAYTVLNYTNNWGVTLGAGVLATGFLSAVKLESTGIKIVYPTTVHWFFVIFSWIVMIRFFVRSALALVNMYRWNELIFSSSKVLSLSDEDPNRPLFERNLAKKIDSYFFRWRSPRTKRYIIWHSLKLMYMWLFLVVLGLFGWGVACLPRNLYYFIGLAIFLGSTVLESVWFGKWYGMKFEKLELEPEPDILEVWRSPIEITSTCDQSTLIFGFCNDGPYRHATSTVTNPAVTWLPWSYHIRSIDAKLEKDLVLGVGLVGKRVLFASWDSNFKGVANPIRCGRIDHFIYANQLLRVTVFLEDCSSEEKAQKIVVKDPKILCQYG